MPVIIKMTNKLYLLLLTSCNLVWAVDLQTCTSLYQNQKYNDYIDKCSHVAEYDINTAMNIYKIYSNNNITVMNKQNSIMYLKQAANIGSIEAQRKLCTGYFDGSIGYTNYDQSFWWCSKFITRNDNDALLVLANEYTNGLGTTKNHIEARKIYTILAEQDNSTAQYQLADIFLGESNTQQGYYWLRQSYTKGNIQANLRVKQIIDIDNCDSSDMYFNHNLGYKLAFSTCVHKEQQQSNTNDGNIRDVFDNNDNQRFNPSSPSDVGNLFNFMMLGQ